MNNRKLLGLKVSFTVKWISYIATLLPIDNGPFWPVKFKKKKCANVTIPKQLFGVKTADIHIFSHICPYTDENNKLPWEQRWKWRNGTCCPCECWMSQFHPKSTVCFLHFSLLISYSFPHFFSLSFLSRVRISFLIWNCTKSLSRFSCMSLSVLFSICSGPYSHFLFK